MRRGRRIAGVSLLAFALLAAACGGGGTGGGGTGGGGGGETGGGGGGRADLTIANFSFEPSTLQVSEGQTITVTNEDSVAHTFTTDDGAVDVQVGGGETVEVTLSGVSSGGFHCEFHPSMTGTLEVG
ncbi:MAG TPA: cupredoxin domain-containing protein [Actinomycetota bacterium]|nr:cupredoxin domain-containing protein [Actinomycetota bacterium]